MIHSIGWGGALVSFSRILAVVFILLALGSIALTFRVDSVWLDIAGVVGGIINAVAANMFWQRG